jgi:hypothetical protein
MKIDKDSKNWIRVLKNKYLFMKLMFNFRQPLKKISKEKKETVN